MENKLIVGALALILLSCEEARPTEPEPEQKRVCVEYKSQDSVEILALPKPGDYRICY